MINRTPVSQPDKLSICTEHIVLLTFDSQGLSQHKCNLSNDNFTDGPAFRVFDTSKSVTCTCMRYHLKGNEIRYICSTLLCLHAKPRCVRTLNTNMARAVARNEAYPPIAASCRSTRK
ncbi:hypothetical protein EMCRGX_G026574 [Ephydatia muelleri]